MIVSVESCDEKRKKYVDGLMCKWYKIIYEMEGCNIKYENINKLFNFIDVTDNYILLKKKEEVEKVYIYELEPVTILNFSMDVQSNILSLYNEFLRELNYDFQIYISNKRINVESYINNLSKIINTKASKEYIELMNKYLQNISRELEDKMIYTTKYYIIISFKRDSVFDITHIDSIIQKLDYVGCNTKRIKKKENIKNILYESFNKEVLV